MSASFRTISFTFEAVRGEYLSRTQRATQRPAILSMQQKEIYGKPYVRRIYIYIYILYIYIYIYTDAAEAKLVSVGLAQARPNYLWASAGWLQCRCAGTAGVSTVSLVKTLVPTMVDAQSPACAVSDVKSQVVRMHGCPAASS